MRILITNDDGISSPVLPLLATKLSELGKVTVVAPKMEQSGMSQAIDFSREVEIKRVDLAPNVEAYAMDSTPADCVRFGVTGLKKEYDLLISGINKGYNLGDDIVYSGTIGAIFEGARLGLRGIALSTDFDNLIPSLAHWDAIYAFLKEKALLSHHSLYNINIPHTVKGFAITRQGGMFYSDDFEYRGNDKYIQVGAPIEYDTCDLTVDIDAIRHNYISITPMTAARTDFVAFEKLKALQ
ncbi:MAG: 5'/3'-nucleotidase SurE [Clostridia bacterium]|nr:5'/3'-nucleotidase SurE [Clostridia bacterium]